MKFKHIIGLDIGTNSLGWCLLKEFEDGRIEIVKTGVHIFPIGTIVDDVSNKEKTKNEQRRSYRSASRMRYRFKLRRENLKEALEKLGMLPDYSKLFKPHSKAEKKKLPNYLRGQSFDLYKLRADAINPENKIALQEIGRIFMLLNKYRGFKSNAKKLGVTDKEVGKVEDGCKQLQAYINKSGAQTIGEYFFKMHEKAKELYDTDKWHNFNEPVDERAYNQESGEFILFNSNGIRRHHGRYTLRDMYHLEFDKIWAAQKNHYPELFTGSKAEYDEILKKPYQEKITTLKEFKKTNYWHIREYCIYYQRPLKSQRRYISNCQFERGQFEIKPYLIVEDGIEKQKEERHWTKKAKKACPRSHPLFQEFRIWQKLHQVRYSSVVEDTYRKALKNEWLPIVAYYLNENNEISLSKPTKKNQDGYWIGRLLLDNGLIKSTDGYNFFIDEADEDVDGDDKNENKILGNTTYARFKEALGIDLFEKLKNETIEKQEQINESTWRTVTESRLLQLWNIIHQSKDGLFKEDDWLMDILTEPTKWNFSKEQASKVLELGLQPDYASYSSKVLKAILPFMRQGLNEHESLKATGNSYINEDNTVGEKVQLRDKISQLTYQELRNPVVERALSKTVKLVNAILEKYKSEIDRNSLEIRIESTRQFRKPRQERENERRKNADKDKLREQYAAYLTKNKEKLGFKKDIYKHDPIVNKYELWLQMNLNETDEEFINEFKAFSKITRQEDKLKYKLWFECGRRCPYTGQIINFTDCFSSEVEIEHIIPLSRSLDNSFNNKTLTYRATNAAKGGLTPLEYLSKIGGDAIKNFKTNINGKSNAFSDSKKELFFADKIPADFSNNQITNTSYIAKYTRRKMQEVCKNVQFTNGSATSELRSFDWGISNLLDKIRYEEDYKINIDEYYQNFYRIKKEFTNWCKTKHKTSDLKINWYKLSENDDLKQYTAITKNDLLYWDEGIQKFNEFRNKSGKKDRSDHRHHAIDAFVTACCSPKIIKELSAYNAIRESQHIRDRDKIERAFNYEQLKEAIASILVSHSEKQTLIKKRKNRIKTKEGIIEHINYAPQGKLHEESFYAKRNGATVRRVELFDDQRKEKALFTDITKLD
jgi:CRISPR-associated endonuclease Csn1